MAPTSNIRRFVHLRVHSSYSLGVGLSSPADVCMAAQRSGYDTVALTDIHGTYGFVAFHHAARSLGIKPIYGTVVVLDSRIDEAAPPDERHTATLLALDRVGLANVCAAASVSASRRESGESVQLNDLAGLDGGVVCIVGLPSTVSSVLPRTSRSVLAALHSQFGDRLYVESLAHVPPPQEESRQQLQTLAETLRISPVLVQDVRFVGREKHDLIDLIGSAAESAVAAGTASHRMLTLDEVSELYHRDPSAYTNASLIAAGVQPDILDALGTSTRRARRLPGIEEGEDTAGVFESRVRAAFEREFSGAGADERAGWETRLKAELDIILGIELEDTFLQFEQIVGGVRRAAGMPGPATGLRLQSLCAYLLGVTAFNPYVVDAGFQPSFDERERANHILDLQVPSGARDAATDVIRSLFDAEGIGYVPAVEHVSAARALRMVAKRLDPAPKEFDEVVSIASRSAGMNLQELCTQNKRVGWLYKKSALLREAISRAAAVEGLPFGFIRSRRTLIVSPTPIGKFLGRTTNPETGERFIQSTRESFPIGSISRVDVSTLTALSVCERLGVGAPGGTSWEAVVSRDDVYRGIARGDLDGIYLLEPELMQRLAADFGIASFDDLVCFLALTRYRRGGASLAERVGAFRDDKRRPPPLPAPLDTVAAPTGGWVLFDDQLRDMVRELTGLDPLNSAQMVRRFARQRPADLAALRNEFMMFAVEYGTPMETAREGFTRILHAARATVSRQHIIGDALIVSAMLYFSRRQPAEYYAALVNVHQGNEARREAYLKRLEAVSPLLPVDITRSGTEYQVEHTGVRPPLSSIPGIGEESARKIVAWRERNKLGTPREFDCLVRDSGITLNMVDALVGAGALEPVGISAQTRWRRKRAPGGEKARGHAPSQLEFDLGASGPDDPDPSTR